MHPLLLRWHQLERILLKIFRLDLLESVAIQFLPFQAFFAFSSIFRSKQGVSNLDEFTISDVIQICANTSNWLECSIINEP